MKPEAPVTSTCWPVKAWSSAGSRISDGPALDSRKHFITRPGNIFREIDFGPGQAGHIFEAEAIGQDQGAQHVVVGILHVGACASHPNLLDEHRQIARPYLKESDRFADKIGLAGPL